ncbi:DNA topoisomerase IV subunit A, partial [bacterium]|nr:DNA topoisomerase IV subunit A [bacterium]
LDELAKEREKIEKTLSSETRLRGLIRQELELIVKKFGDARRSPIVSREESQALTESDLIPVEAITVLLSNKGWVRAAKGHDIDLEKLTFRTGDGLKDLAYGKSNQLAIFMGSSGRSYTLAAHSLPSARGHGEPLSGRLQPPPGAVFESVIMGDPDQDILLASSIGYGFIAKLSDLYTKNRNGKSVLRFPPESHPLPPVHINDLETDRLVAISNEGHMLIFSVNQLPILPRGKGNKIINIFPAKNESVIILTVVPADSKLVVHAGKRHLTLDEQSIATYSGERGRRGQKLPKGLRKVDRLEIVEAFEPEPESDLQLSILPDDLQ